MRRISGRNHSLRSGLSRRQLSSTIAVLARALHLHFSSLRHGDYRRREDKPKMGQITDRRRNRWIGVNVPHAPRPAEWGAILFLCLPTLTRPGLDLGLSRTGETVMQSQRRATSPTSKMFRQHLKCSLTAPRRAGTSLGFFLFLVTQLAV